MKKLLFTLLFISSLFSAYGMDNGNSTGSTFIMCDVAPRLVIKNSSQTFVRTQLNKSYIKWFHSLPPALQSKIKVIQAAKLYAQNRVNHYLKKSCIHAVTINPSVKKPVLKKAVVNLTKQLNLDAYEHQIVKNNNEILLDKIRTSNKPTLRQLNQSQAYALQMQQYEDRMEFTQWQIKKAKSFIKHQETVTKNIQNTVDQKLSSISGNEYTKAVKNSLVTLKIDYINLETMLKKRLNRLKNAENKQQTLKALKFLEDIRRRLYANKTKQAIYNKALRQGAKTPSKQNLEIAQPTQPLASPSTQEADVTLDYSTTTPSSGIITSEMRKTMCKMIDKIRNKPIEQRTEWEQERLKVWDSYKEAEEALVSQESAWTQSIKPITNLLEKCDQLLEKGLEHMRSEAQYIDGYTDSEILNFCRKYNIDEKYHQHFLKDSRSLKEYMNNEEINVGFLKGMIKKTKSVLDHPVDAVVDAAHTMAHGLKDMTVITADIAFDVSMILAAQDDIEMMQEGISRLDKKYKALTIMLDTQWNYYRSLPTVEQGEAAGTMAIDLALYHQVVKGAQKIASYAKRGAKRLGKKQIKKTVAEIPISIARCEKLAKEITDGVKVNGMKHAGTFEEVTAKLSKMDPAIGSLETLEQAVAEFKNVPGFYHKDGAFMKIIENMDKKKNFLTAKGAMYEVEKALELSAQGYKITGLEVSYKPKPGMGGKRATFDIQIGNKVIECKSWKVWNSTRIEKIQDQVRRQLKMVQQHQLIYEIHFKNAISQEVKEFLTIHNVHYFVG